MLYAVVALSTGDTTAFGQVWQPFSDLDSTILVRHQVDHLSNHYVVTPQMQILKLKPDGSYWHRYDNNRLGAIGTLDVSNPLKLLVYYPQHQTIVLLDNNMAETGKLLLARLGLGYIRGVGLSDDNHIWLWNETDRMLVKINHRGELIMQGIPAYNFTLDPQRPVHLLQRGNYITISQEGMPIQVFDLFGKWVRSISDIEGFQKILVMGNELTYLTMTGIWRRNIVEPWETETLLVEIERSVGNYSFDISNNRVYRINEAGILEFKLL